MRAFTKSIVLTLLMSSGSVATAKAETLIDIMAAQGCAVGSSTRLLANESGYANDAIDALVAEAGAAAETIRTGEWVVLPSSR